MKNYRNIAGAYHRALELGLVDGEEIVAWTDGDHVVLLAALQEVPGELDEVARRRLVFGLMLAAVERNADLTASVVDALHSMALDKDVPDADAEASMLRFKDELSGGGDVRSELAEFLRKHGEAI